MSVKEIEAAIAQRRQELWDKRIEDDLESGRLDAVLEEVEREYRAGLAKPMMPRRG